MQSRFRSRVRDIINSGAASLVLIFEFLKRFLRDFKAASTRFARRVPYSRGAFLWQIPFFCVVLRFLAFTPPSGYANDLLGVAAIVSAIRGLKGLTTGEGIAWIVIGVSLCGVEMKATRKDRADQAAEFKQVLDQNQKELDQNSRQFAETIGRMKALANLGVENIEQVTGGDSFSFVRFYFQGDAGYLTAEHSGKYQLHDVVAHLFDVEKLTKWQRQHPGTSPNSENSYPGEMTYTLGNIAVNGFYDLGKYDLSSSAVRAFSVVFTALNGTWSEDIQLRRINGKWMQAYRVYRDVYRGNNRAYELVLTRIDAGFPRYNGRVWNWAPYPVVHVR